MSTKPLISGKVAAIVTKTGLVINKGALDGVSNGTKFVVRLTVGPIVDPDDPSNTMETLHFTKGRVTINSVYPRMSWGTLEGTTTTSSLFESTLLKVQPPQTSYPSTIQPLIKPEDWLIKVGDVVLEVPDDTTK
jgi:hypothetical protein